MPRANSGFLIIFGSIPGFKSKLSFAYKMIREIISMPRARLGCPHNLGVNSRVFKDESPKLKPIPTADVKCVRSWHVQNMHNVHSWHVTYIHKHMHKKILPFHDSKDLTRTFFLKKYFFKSIFFKLSSLRCILL